MRLVLVRSTRSRKRWIKLMGKGPLLPRRTSGMFRGESSVTASDDLGPPGPEPSHPRRSSDTAPKGAETHPGDGRLSVGTASMPFFYIYHVRRRKPARAENQSEGDPRSGPRRARGIPIDP